MIIVVLVGGKGTLVGPLVGALLVTLLEEYLREAKELRLSIFGLIVIADRAVPAARPDGLPGRAPRATRQSSAARGARGAAVAREGACMR